MNALLPRNESSIDRILRVVGGAAMVAFALLSTSPLAWIGWFGLIFVVTGAVGTCPIYMALGVSSCPIDTSAKPEA